MADEFQALSIAVTPPCRPPATSAASVGGITRCATSPAWRLSAVISAVAIGLRLDSMMAPEKNLRHASALLKGATHVPWFKDFPPPYRALQRRCRHVPLVDVRARRVCRDSRPVA